MHRVALGMHFCFGTQRTNNGLCVDAFQIGLNSSHLALKPDMLCDIICALFPLLWWYRSMIVREYESAFLKDGLCQPSFQKEKHITEQHAWTCTNAYLSYDEMACDRHAVATVVGLGTALKTVLT